MNSQNTPQKISNYDDIAASISDIVRFTMNENFRKNCYQVLNVTSTKALQEVINNKFRQLSTAKTASQMKKFEIALKEDDIVISDGEESFDPNWILAASVKHKNLKRRASVANLLFDESDKENTPVKFFSQRLEQKDYKSAGKVAQMQFNSLQTSSGKILYKSPSQRYLEDALKGPARRRDRTQDVPEKTRKILFFEDKPITKLFE